MAMRAMQAAVLETFGGSFKVASVARPAPAPGEVLVRIAASAVNPLDIKIRQGEAPHARHPLPAILGIDMAGVVDAIGPGVTGFRRGDEVYGMTGGVGAACKARSPNLRTSMRGCWHPSRRRCRCARQPRFPCRSSRPGRD